MTHHKDLQQYIDYAEGLEAREYVINWLSTTLNNYLHKSSPSIEEVEHVIDYLRSNDIPKIKQMSYPQALKKAQKWNEGLQKKASKIEELEEDVKVVLDFKDGYKVVQLIDKRAYEREGYLMRNCVASYYGRDVKIYSLRDSFNNPHCTMEQDQQIKGKGNGDIHPKYVDYVVKFLEWTGMKVRDSEMAHLGYEVAEFPKYIITPTYRNRYIRKGTKIEYKKTVAIFDTPQEAESYTGKKKVLLRGSHELNSKTVWNKIETVGGYLSINSQADLKAPLLKTVGGYLSINTKIDKRTAWNLIKNNSLNKWYISRQANDFLLTTPLQNVEYID